MSEIRWMMFMVEIYSFVLFFYSVNSESLVVIGEDVIMKQLVIVREIFSDLEMVYWKFKLELENVKEEY